MPRLPCRLPQEDFPGSEGTKVLRKELGIRIPQSQTDTSLYRSQVIFLAKRGGKSLSSPVAFIPEGEREGEKKNRQFCDVFGNWLKQTGKSPLI